MELKTGLLIWWILMMTCRPSNMTCDVVKSTHLTKDKMEGLLNKFNSANGKAIIPLPKPISQLNLKNLSSEQKIKKAQCGLNFMQKALQLIHQHQSELYGSTKLIFKEIKKTADHVLLTEHCVAHYIGKCKNMTEPHFQHEAIYKRKQWGCTVLKNSVDFLGELPDIIHHESNEQPKKLCI